MPDAIQRSRMQQRRGTSAVLESLNPILLPGEFGFDVTKKLLKIGDGTTAWNDLPALLMQAPKDGKRYVQVNGEWAVHTCAVCDENGGGSGGGGSGGTTKPTFEQIKEALTHWKVTNMPSTTPQTGEYKYMLWANGPDVIVVQTGGSTENTFASPDLTTWNSIPGQTNAGGVSDTLLWADWLNSLLSIKYYNSNIFQISNGAASAWTEKTLPIKGYWAGNAVSPTKKIICLYDPFYKKTLTSTDAVNWVQHTVPNQPTLSGAWANTIWADFLGKFVFLNSERSTAGVSVDGAAWEFSAPNLDRKTVSTTACANSLQGLFLLKNGSNMCYKSTDGLTYTVHSQLPFNATYWNFAWSPWFEVFCAIGYSSEVPHQKAYISQDALTWEEVVIHPDYIHITQTARLIWADKLKAFCVLGNYSANMLSSNSI